MANLRKNEPDYALLRDEPAPETNRYGMATDLAARSGLPVGESMHINGDAGVGETVNRNRQHGFYFKADNCIGCHACEAACSEKNDLPPHIAFRSVGYVESGAWPAVTRLNISMACNHCDDPVCLKGCPTRAYTKFAEYGAVLQDPDICFGCGYCTWVCPYNAPQLDTGAGHVQKCNMCVDRLEAGLKPACVAACLGHALDFGVIETVPPGRTGCDVAIPGFPDPAITRPNIRFEVDRPLGKRFTRTDSVPLAYRGTGKAASYRAEPDRARLDERRRLGFSRLSSRENPLVLFTLATQATLGAFALLFLAQMLAGLEGFESARALAQLAATPAYGWGLLVLLGLQAGALVLSTLHLGRPHRFYRGFNNLRHSPVSREALAISVFFAALGLHWLAIVTGPAPRGLGLLPGALNQPVASVAGGLALLAGLAGLGFMVRIYRIPARPFWDHPQVAYAFFGTAATLGAGLIALLWLGAGAAGLALPSPAIASALGLVIALGLAIEGLGLVLHARAMRRKGGEGALAHHEQTHAFAGAYGVRGGLLALNGMAALTLALWPPTGAALPALWLALVASLTLSALIGRALFYVLVIPTTMPGAFFWRNRGFEAHARATGLADRPQSGLAPAGH